jgi:hypothetical protein
MTELAKRFAGSWDCAFSSSAAVYLAVAAALNAPFVLCHPEWPVVAEPLLRSLVINIVLFLAPGLPVMSLMIRRGWVPRFELLWVIVLSFVIFLAAVLATHLFGFPGQASLIWNGTWIVTNLGLLLHMLVGGWSRSSVRLNGKRVWSFILLFVFAYLIFFCGATRIVPIRGDEDDEVQGTAYGLLTQLKPSLLTSRNTEYYFAHPPLAHLYVAGSLLYYNLLDELAFYDSQSRHRMNVKELLDNYNQHPYLLESRTPNLFFSALTVALLGGWVARMTGCIWFGTLVALTYGTTAEVFVRSCYGGYFASSNFALLQILLAVETWMSDRERFTWLTCVLAGIFAALADHKLMLLPASIVVWEALRLWQGSNLRGAAKSLLHPVAIGFAVGTMMFWAYGLAISPNDFWMDHVRHHLVDRVLNYNARGLDMSEYPSVPGLWLEFWRHTGYLLLPLGMVSLGFLCFGKKSTVNAGNDNSVSGWRGMPGLWGIWALLIAVAFSIIDWRQTKHIASLSLPLFLGLARIASEGVARIIVSILLVALIVWNIGVLWNLAGNFEFLTKVPEW